jgi:hypothetical protein
MIHWHIRKRTWIAMFVFGVASWALIVGALVLVFGGAQ